MKYLSVCDGIGAAHVAWKPLGWQCVGASEIAPFPKAVVEHRHPEIPALGSMTEYHEWNIEQPELVCGGTPCQSFSVAGLRKGMADPRGNLSLVFLGVVDHFRPRWVVWENVPGVLSSNGGRDFGAFIGGLGQLGYGFAYRVLDAQYFGLAQRRKRVFVVGHLGDWRRAAAVLFERESLRWHPAPSRSKGKGVAADVAPSLTNSGRGVERAGESRGQDPVIAHSLRAEGFDASEDGTGRGVPIVMAHGQANAEVVSDGSPSLTCNHEAPIVFDPAQVTSKANRSNPRHGAACHTLHQGSAPMLIRMREGKEGGGKGPLVSEDQSLTLATANDQVLAFTENSMRDDGSVPTLVAGEKGGGKNAINMPHTAVGMQVRRLTAEECEALQGFPRGYTNVPWRGKPTSPDGPRYKALGNSWAVPVVNWIGQRIEQVDAIAQ